MSNWQTVYSTTLPHQAEIVKDLLINAGLAAIVFNLQDHSYRIGSLEVKVKREDVLRAIKLINEDISFSHE
ncbi:MULTISPECIES: DUF2007 domain-containing protein [Roseivirga]|uniref:DUF2007 domain-containing protein n=1 Tax=Roseivirga thermotolerans TaxID=1758176 RepID=A0ABQ3I9N4_9BACT|nr:MULTISPECIES: DUF2007 domain-containing protein [Roseivirga]MEC7754600.1 DUF2007 domain-containing protein [Bacteroidota bacterium]GHE74709.1 hypothetical protein GCM10011340_34300 [Roseivirga thermotolerans]